MSSPYSINCMILLSILFVVMLPSSSTEPGTVMMINGSMYTFLMAQSTIGFWAINAQGVVIVCDNNACFKLTNLVDVADGPNCKFFGCQRGSSW